MYKQLLTLCNNSQLPSALISGDDGETLGKDWSKRIENNKGLSKIHREKITKVEARFIEKIRKVGARE